MTDRQAHFMRDVRELMYFDSRNTSISVNCESEKQARAIIAHSGITQELISYKVR